MKIPNDPENPECDNPSPNRTDLVETIIDDEFKFDTADDVAQSTPGWAPEQQQKFFRFASVLKRDRRVDLCELATSTLEFLRHAAADPRPEWLGRYREKICFFERPDADANFRSWARAASWEPEEAAALLLGKDPELVNSRSFELLPLSTGKVRDRFFEIARLLKKDPDVRTPSAVAIWAEQHGVDVPDALRSGIAKPSKAVTPSGEKRTTETLQTILAAFAVESGYRHGKKNEAVSKLMKVLNKYNIGITDDTVRRHVRQGYEMHSWPTTVKPNSPSSKTNSA